jgi:hypothetical protein
VFFLIFLVKIYIYIYNYFLVFFYSFDVLILKINK